MSEMAIKSITRMTLGITMFGLVGTAYAVGQGFYFGGMLGQTNLHGQTVNLNVPEQNFTCQGVTFSASGEGEIMPQSKGIGSRIFLGGNFNQYAGLEFGFAYYTPISYKTTIQNLVINDETILTNTNINNNLLTHAYSFDIMGKGMLPISNSGFSVFFKGGGAYIKTNTTGNFENTCGIPTSTFNYITEKIIGERSTSTVRPIAALGISYDITQRWVVDLSYTRLFYNSTYVKNPDFIAMGISYHLVDQYCGQFLC